MGCKNWLDPLLGLWGRIAPAGRPLCVLLVCFEMSCLHAMSSLDEPSSITGRPAPLKVPRVDGAWLQRPEAQLAADWLSENAQSFASADVDLQGYSLARLRSWSRSEVFRAARAYMSPWAAVADRELGSIPWVVGGHQPALFHPGVWAKNFAMGRLAQNATGISLNLVVDNDTLTSKAIKVPVGTTENPRVIAVPFDETQFQQPWEEVTVQNRSVFNAFGEQVQSQLRGWTYDPLVKDFWPDVIRHSQSNGRVADAFTAARNIWERKWGLDNLELPLSRLCQLPPFLWFVSHVVAHLPRFAALYNQSVRDYRRRNGIHSTSHPVPELIELGEWLEAPFWVWRAGDRRRSRLFARQLKNSIELSVDGRESLGELPLTIDTTAERAVTRLQELQAAGLHLRTRALTTTLFNRVCLADLFVHGIGGAKYDEITDELIAQFWGLPVPRYWTVSGTLQLPLGRQPATCQDLVNLQRELWDLKWNPCRALKSLQNPQVQQLTAEFDEILHQPATTLAARKIRHVELSRIKNALNPWIREQWPDAQAQLQTVSEQLAANQILQDREYSYVLYPQDKLRRFLTDSLDSGG